MTIDNIKRYSRALEKKHKLILIFFFIFASLNFLLTEYFAVKRRGLGELINISGRQRMLSQRIYLQKLELESERLDRQELENSFNRDIKLFKTSHELLQNNASSEIKSYYTNELNSKVDKFYVYLTPSYSLSPADAKFIKGEFLKKLNEVVGLFEKESTFYDKVQEALNIFIFFAFVALLAILKLRILDIIKKTSIEALENFNREKEKAKKALNIKGLFLANMSHEIRTPLAGIIGLTDLAIEDSENTTKDYLVDIKKSSESLKVIINDILDLSQIEYGKVKIEKKNFRLKDLLGEVHSVLYPKAVTKKIDFNLIESDVASKFICSDPVRLKQILINLVNNAIKFTKVGKVTISLEKNGDWLIMRVTDTGIGMGAEDQRKLFQNFSQLENTYVKTQEGTGFGLSISKKLSNLLGGDITITSKVGVGSTFSCMLPLEVFDLDEESKERKSSPPRCGFDVRYKILVAEDNIINQKVISKHLEKLNLQFDMANNGLEAVELFNKNRYSCTLMDISMPKMNGLEATTKILAKDKNALIFALSANMFSEDKLKAKEAGMKEFLGKPVERDKLVEVLNLYFPKSQKIAI